MLIPKILSQYCILSVLLLPKIQTSGIHHWHSSIIWPHRADVRCTTWTMYTYIICRSGHVVMTLPPLVAIVIHAHEWRVDRLYRGWICGICLMVQTEGWARCIWPAWRHLVLRRLLPFPSVSMIVWMDTVGWYSMFLYLLVLFSKDVLEFFSCLCWYVSIDSLNVVTVAQTASLWQTVGVIYFFRKGKHPNK